MTEPDLRPFTPVRRRTAEHMLLSRATSAHAFVAVDADYERVDAARRSAGLTYLPYVITALARVVRDFPLVNASVVAEGVVVHPEVNVGVAIDLGERGLIVPVVRDAGSLTVAEIAAAIASSAERARARRLPPSKLRDGTITVTNLGMFGTTLTIPIINQPQVAIIATDGVRLQPVALDRDTVEVRARGTLGLSFDHRAFDGAYAAGFLRAVADALGGWEGS